MTLAFLHWDPAGLLSFAFCCPLYNDIDSFAFGPKWITQTHYIINCNNLHIQLPSLISANNAILCVANQMGNTFIIFRYSRQCDELKFK